MAEMYDAEALWNYALRVLGRRALTIGELKKKLVAKAAVAADIDSVLSRLKEYRFVNDRQFADSYAAARRDGAGHGKARILRELNARQVPKIVAETAVSQAFAEVDEVEHAAEFLRRKVRGKDLKEPKQFQSAFRKLRYNGFSSNAAVQAIKRTYTGAPVDESLLEVPEE
jgi:regulatory protein